MTQEANIEIIISPDGNIKLTVKGIKGESCIDHINWLENILGKVQERKYTSEYYDTPIKIETLRHNEGA